MWVGNRGARKAQRVEDESCLVAVEGDTLVIHPGRDARSGWKTEDITGFCKTWFPDSSVSPHSLEGSASSACPSLRPTSQPFSGPSSHLAVCRARLDGGREAHRELRFPSKRR